MGLFIFSSLHIIISLCRTKLLLCLFNLFFFSSFFIAGGGPRALQAAVLLLDLTGSSCARVRKKEPNPWKNKEETRILFVDYLFIGRICY